MGCCRLRVFQMRVLVISCATLFVLPARAQITDVTNVTSTPIPGAGHDYIKMLNETVNPSNGSVSVRIQTPTPPGRRLSLSFAFAYDTNGAHHMQTDGLGNVEWWDNSAYLAAGGWSYSVPMLNLLQLQESCTPGHCGPGTLCTWYNDLVFQDESGGRHPLYLAVDLNPLVCQYGTPIVPTQKYSGGDDIYRAAFTNTSPSPVLVADADGTVYTLNCCASGHDILEQDTTISRSKLVSSIEDRNGNKIAVADNGNGSLAVTDTLGRTMLSTSGFGSSGNTVTVSGLSSPYSLTWGTASSNYAVYDVNLSPLISY